MRRDGVSPFAVLTHTQSPGCLTEQLQHRPQAQRLAPPYCAAQHRVLPTATWNRAAGKGEKQQPQENRLALGRVTPGRRKHVSNKQGLLAG